MSGPERRSRRAGLLRLGAPVLVLALLAGLVVLLMDRGSGDADQVAATPPSTASSAPAGTTAAPAPASAPATAPATTPAPATETATAAASPLTEALAAPVAVREGVAESERTVQVATVDFTAPADWSDGASVRVVDAHQQVTGGQGPGALAGQPQTVFTLEVVNGSKAALDLNAVVVQATYGKDQAQAAPLYDADTVDFAGTAEPGATATAVYSFAVPADQLGDVALSVDVDGHRFPAVFTGAVPAR